MQTVPYLRKLHQSADRARLLLVVLLVLLLVLLLYALQHIAVHVRDIRFLLLHFLGHFGRHLV